MLGVLGQVFLTGLATIVVSRAVVGKPVTLTEAWAELRPNLLRLLGVSILFGLAVLVGAVLCVLPGIWVAVLFSFAMPALVLERLTVGQAFQRPKALVRDAWWSTFGILVAAVGIGWVVNLSRRRPNSRDRSCGGSTAAARTSSVQDRGQAEHLEQPQVEEARHVRHARR